MWGTPIPISKVPVLDLIIVTNCFLFERNIHTFFRQMSLDTVSYALLRFKQTEIRYFLLFSDLKLLCRRLFIASSIIKREWLAWLNYITINSPRNKSPLQSSRTLMLFIRITKRTEWDGHLSWEWMVNQKFLKPKSLTNPENLSFIILGKSIWN